MIGSHVGQGYMAESVRGMSPAHGCSVQTTAAARASFRRAFDTPECIYTVKSLTY
jgi:hypothetical protein